MRRPLNKINYNHLFYFWHIVREGSVLRASQKLKVAQPTVSEQLRALEESLGEKLFDRAGKRLVLTEIGQVVYRYANEIFLLGREMQDAIQDRATGRALRLEVGVAEAMPKLIASRLLEPALRMAERPDIVVYENRTDRLLAQLAVHTLDIVLSDAVLEPSFDVRIYRHLLGECGITLYAKRAIAARLRPWFPKSLDGEPMLFPTANTALRRSMDRWMKDAGIHPKVIGEFQDSALLATFGSQGVGVFPASSAVEDDMREHYRVEVVGRVPDIRQSFYAFSAERKLIHPAVVVLSQAARNELVRG